MNANVDALYHKMEILRTTPHAPTPHTHVDCFATSVLYCEVCEINWHITSDCQMILTGGSIQDNINHVNDNQRNNPYSNT